ncbi:hypothetical protein BC828DRAFT_372607 [Blastocladiella britannica]|nr:hypothetical protein BC828DRAFT_372607 [Blastocladiella britannica]
MSSSSSNSNCTPFHPALAAAIPHHDSSQRITVPVFATVASTRRNGSTAAHPLALSHLSDTGAFLIGYAARTHPLISDIKANNALEVILQSSSGSAGSSRTASKQQQQELWRLDAKAYLAGAPHLLLRYPPPRISAEDPRRTWERARLLAFLRLSPAQRAVLLLPAPGDRPAATVPRDIPDPPAASRESTDDMVDRLLGGLSLGDAAAAASGSPPVTPPQMRRSASGSTPAAAAAPSPPAGAPEFDQALENFVLVVLKISRADVLRYGARAADFERVIHSCSKDGVWSSEVASP